MFRQNNFKIIGIMTLLLAISFITIDTPNVLANSISVNANKEVNEEGYTDLSSAIEAAASGDVIYLHPGVYQLPKTQLDKSLDFKRFGQGTVKIVPSANLQEGESWIHVGEGSKVTFDRIIFDGSNKDIATLIDASGYVEVTNSIIKNISYKEGDGVGIIVQNGGLIYENEFSQIGSKSVVITGTAQTKIIENNFIGKGTTSELDLAILVQSQGDTVITGNNILNHSGTVTEREDGLTSSALYVANTSGEGAGTVTIKENVIEQNHNALIVRDLINNNMTIKMNNNRVINNENTITNLDTDFYIDARMNYYGSDPKGPEDITGLVHYFPWAMSSDYEKVVNNHRSVIVVDDDYESYSDYKYVPYDTNRDDETEHYYYGVNAFSDLSEAVKSAIEGSTIYVEEGVYEFDQSLIIDRGITVKGVNKDSVIVNASNLKNHGIIITNENVGEVELSGFTLIGTNTFHSGIYAGGTRQLELHNIIIQDFLRNGIELNTVSESELHDVTSINNGENGIEVINSKYVTINRVTTSLNGYRGLGIITQDAFFYGIQGVDYITIKNISEIEGGIYLEKANFDRNSITYRITDEGPHANVSILSDEIEYAYHGFHTARDVTHTIFLKNEKEAEPYLNTSDYTSIYLKNLVEKRYTVTDDMDIMDTLNGATDGDEIYLTSGIHYIPKVTIDQTIAFRGDASGESVLKLYEHTDLDEAYIDVAKAKVSFQSLTFDGSMTNVYTAIVGSETLSITDCLFKDIKFGDLFGTAIHIQNGGVIKGTHFERVGRTGILVDSPIGTVTELLNNEYSGKGEGTWLDYGVDIRHYGELTIKDNTIKESLGKTGSLESAGIRFATSTTGTRLNDIQDQSFINNANAIIITEDVPSEIEINIHNNAFTKQEQNIVNNSDAVVHATHNYYGEGTKQPDPDTMVGDVIYFPWVTDETFNTPVNDSVNVLIVDSALSNLSIYDLASYDTNQDGEDEDYYYGVNAFSTVENAIAHTQNGTIVYVMEGNYGITSDILIDSEIKLLSMDGHDVVLAFSNEATITIKASNIVIKNLVFDHVNGRYTPITIDMYNGMNLPSINDNQFKEGATIAFVLNNQRLTTPYIENLIETNEFTSYAYLLETPNTLKAQEVYTIYSSFNDGFSNASLGDYIVFREGGSSLEEEIRIGDLIESFLSDFVLTHGEQVVELRSKIIADSFQYYYKLNDEEWTLYEDEFIISKAGLNELQIEVRDEVGNSLTVYNGTIVLINSASNLSNLVNLTVEVNQEVDYIYLQESLRGMNYIDEIEIDADSVDLTQVGSYDVTYTVRDLLGNEQRKTIQVNVIDTNAPTIRVRHIVLNSSDFSNISLVEDNRLIELLELDQYISDDYDEAPSITVEQTDLGINFGELGVYQVKVVVTDSSGNTTEQMIKVIITDQTAPEVTLEENRFELFTKDIDWLSFCNVSDDYFGTDQIQVRVLSTNVDVSKVGAYQLMIQATDPLGNTLEKTFDIYIEDTKAPVIKGLDKERTIKAGDEFNPLANLTFVDEGTEDLSELILVLGDYDVDEPGEYTITIAVEDESGNLTIESYTLVVEQNTWKVILIGLGGFSLLIAVIVVINAIRNRNGGDPLDDRINDEDGLNVMENRAGVDAMADEKVEFEDFDDDDEIIVDTMEESYNDYNDGQVNDNEEEENRVDDDDDYYEF